MQGGQRQATLTMVSIKGVVEDKPHQIKEPVPGSEVYVTCIANAITYAWLISYTRGFICGLGQYPVLKLHLGGRTK